MGYDGNDLRVLPIAIIGALLAATLWLLLFGPDLNRTLNTVAIFIAAFYFGRWVRRKQ